MAVAAPTLAVMKDSRGTMSRPARHDDCLLPGKAVIFMAAFLDRGEIIDAPGKQHRALAY
jgi:hypothetical protein